MSGQVTEPQEVSAAQHEVVQLGKDLHDLHVEAERILSHLKERAASLRLIDVGRLVVRLRRLKTLAKDLSTLTNKAFDDVGQLFSIQMIENEFTELKVDGHKLTAEGAGFFSLPGKDDPRHAEALNWLIETSPDVLMPHFQALRAMCEARLENGEKIPDFIRQYTKMSTGVRKLPKKGELEF